MYEQTYPESRTEVEIFSEMQTAVLHYSHHMCKLEYIFLSSTKTPQNIYIYIWIPASHPAVTWALRHVRLLSKNKRSK